ncbi:MAG: hypothetical protein ACYTXA_24860 [Nostoc sp.]
MHFPESKIESFDITQDSITVNIKKGLEIYPPHPLSATSKFDEPCKVIFKGVISSKRIFNEYNDVQTKGFRQHLFNNEFDYSCDTCVDYSEYLIEGLFIKPLGWIEWEITAAEFYIDDLKD